MTDLALENEALYSTLGSDPDLGEIVEMYVDEMYVDEMYVDEMPDRIAALIDSFESRDMEKLRTTAHQIKGSAGGYGFAQLTPFAAKLENSIREHKLENETREALEELTILCRRVRAGTPS